MWGQIGSDEIQSDDQRVDVSNRELIEMMDRLNVCPIVLDQIQQTQDEDEFLDRWLAYRAHPGLTRDTNGFVRMRGWLYI